MLCIVCFDLWVLMRPLKSTKRPAGRDPLAEDLIKHRQISQLIIDLLSPKAQGRLIAHRPRSCHARIFLYKPVHKFWLWEICMKNVFKIHGKVH